MGQVRKENLKDYWLTDPAVKTPDFAKLMLGVEFSQFGNIGTSVITQKQKAVRTDYSK
jgi:hypothetical protein